MDHVKASVTALKSDGIFEAFQNFDQNLQQEARFLRSYMVMYKILLHFVRANREGDWQLHLTSLNAVIPYFFVHDQTNYARPSPLYLTTMKELEYNGGDSWSYLKENFSVNKSEIPFSSVGSDHALEQENRSLKVTGGVKGLTQEPTALYRYCLSAPSLNDISKAFCKEHKIESTEQKAHYQLSGSTYTKCSRRFGYFRC